MSFEPIDPDEHERGNLGYDVEDRCRNCHRPYMDHHNGRCPSQSAQSEPVVSPRQYRGGYIAGDRQRAESVRIYNLRCRK